MTSTCGPLTGISHPAGRKKRKVQGKHSFLWMWWGSCTHHFCSPPIGQDLSHGPNYPQGKLGNIVCQYTWAVMFPAIISGVQLLKRERSEWILVSSLPQLSLLSLSLSFFFTESISVQTMIDILRDKASGVCIDSELFLTTASVVSVLPQNRSSPCIHYFTGTPDPSRFVWNTVT